jgi:hypothetical protein
MSFTCDLVDNAKRHIRFLEKLHELGITFATSSTQSLYRYQHCWLPLVYKHPKEQLIPPPDIAWLWHCHRLAPKNYITYIKQTFGQGATVEANPPFSFQIPAGSQDNDSSPAAATRDLWETTYHDESFFLIDSAAEVVAVAGSESSDNGRHTSAGHSCLLLGFDLLASTERQATFLWQVSGERFQDDDFLEEGVENYTKFLKLKQKAWERQIILVPTYQIDLFWHTHILSSVSNYDADCKAISGGTLHHDDSLTDRSDGGVLDVAYKSTKNLWKDEYGCDYVVCGGMYRGEPPTGFFSTHWKPWNELWHAGGNLHLVGKMGASSTSPPIQWADPSGRTSEGLPAFIATNTRSKSELKKKERMNHYVLGKTANGIGYFHLETKDAHQILHTRVCRRINQLESEIAFDQCCCTAEYVWQPKEAQLAEMKEVRYVLSARLVSTRPFGELQARIDSRRSSNMDNNRYYGGDGIWLYPAFMYNCAGGACGGGVVCSGAGACGGSACGGMLHLQVAL